MSMQRIVSFVMACAALASSGGCNWNDFDDIKKEASIKVYDTPADYRKSKYGSVLTTLRGFPTFVRGRAAAAASSGALSKRKTLLQVRHFASPVSSAMSSAATGTRQEGQRIFMGGGVAGAWAGVESQLVTTQRDPAVFQ